MKTDTLKIATLCLPIKPLERRVLLGMKKIRPEKKGVGVGEGKYNAFGGGVRVNETVVAAAVRELEEECGLRAEPSQLKKMAAIRFHFNGQLLFLVHIFLLEEWFGEPVESDEMGNLEWFSYDQLPFDKMWLADREWLPLVLKGQQINGFAYYNTDGSALNFIRFESTMFS